MHCCYFEGAVCHVFCSWIVQSLKTEDHVITLKVCQEWSSSKRVLWYRCVLSILNFFFFLLNKKESEDFFVFSRSMFYSLIISKMLSSTMFQTVARKKILFFSCLWQEKKSFIFIFILKKGVFKYELLYGFWEVLSIGARRQNVQSSNMWTEREI